MVAIGLAHKGARSLVIHAQPALNFPFFPASLGGPSHTLSILAMFNQVSLVLLAGLGTSTVASAVQVLGPVATLPIVNRNIAPDGFERP
jgi:hypothetical protein